MSTESDGSAAATAGAAAAADDDCATPAASGRNVDSSADSYVVRDCSAAHRRKPSPHHSCQRRHNRQRTQAARTRSRTRTGRMMTLVSTQFVVAGLDTRLMHPHSRVRAPGCAPERIVNHQVAMPAPPRPLRQVRRRHPEPSAHPLIAKQDTRPEHLGCRVRIPRAPARPCSNPHRQPHRNARSSRTYASAHRIVEQSKQKAVSRGTIRT
jgi:hypothetical protein